MYYWDTPQVNTGFGSSQSIYFKLAHVVQLNTWGIADVRDHAINTFESLFYGQYVPQSRRESKATIRRISRVSNISRRTSDGTSNENSQRERLLGMHPDLHAIMSTK